MREALVNSGIEPGQVTYIETHGTGTSLGDPVEVNSIGSVFGATHNADSPVSLGSVKANIGHLEGAAGIASLIKTVLVLEHRTIPPNIHFKNPNPHIPWADLPLHVPTTPTPWSPKGGARIAGISAFGFSGTNVHLLVQEAAAPAKTSGNPERPLHVLPLSAKSEAVPPGTGRPVFALPECGCCDAAGHLLHGRSWPFAFHASCCDCGRIERRSEGEAHRLFSRKGTGWNTARHGLRGGAQ